MSHEHVASYVVLSKYSEYGWLIWTKTSVLIVIPVCKQKHLTQPNIKYDKISFIQCRVMNTAINISSMSPFRVQISTHAASYGNTRTPYTHTQHVETRL